MIKVQHVYETDVEEARELQEMRDVFYSLPRSQRFMFYRLIKGCGKMNAKITSVQPPSFTACLVAPFNELLHHWSHLVC